MPKENYLTIAVTDATNTIFNEFVRAKGLKKGAAMNDVLEFYMLAKDEALYLELKKKYLGIEKAIDMIRDLDSEPGRNDYLFMKLGESITADGSWLNGKETMEVFRRDAAEKNGKTWFFTQSLAMGMSRKKVESYNRRIQSGKKLTMLFALAQGLNGNEIAYSAEVLAIRSYTVPAAAPEGDCPREYAGEKGRIWIQLSNIKPEKNLKASMFKISSTGKDLKDVITKSQYHFGYIEPKNT